MTGLGLATALLLAAAGRGGSEQRSVEEVPDVVSSASEAIPQGAPAVEPVRRADLRLVVTGGLDGGRQGDEGFFDAQLFRSGLGLPLLVIDANARAVRTDAGVFFSEQGELSDEDLARLADAPVAFRQRREVLLGASAVGVLLQEEVLGGAGATGPAMAAGDGREENAEALRRGLAAVSRTAVLEHRVVEGCAAWGLDLTPDDPLLWPATEAPRRRVPAARAVLKHAKGHAEPVFLLARHKAPTSRVLGVVDRLLVEPGAPPTAYVDVGGTLSGARHDDTATAHAMAALLGARKPAVLGTGRAELAAMAREPGALQGAPYIAPLDAAGDGPEALPPLSRVVELGGRRLLFVALGSLGGRARALLPPRVKSLSADVTLERAGAAARNAGADLVVGMALSSEGATAALTSSNFDGVLHLASSRLAALPTVDDIDLRGNHEAGLHPGAGLVRVSSADVTEVFYWFDATGRVERLRIERHPVVDDGPEAADALEALSDLLEAPVVGGGLPARADVGGGLTAWTREDLDALGGALARRAFDTELSLLPHAVAPVAVQGPVPPALAGSWLSERARVLAVEVQGALLDQVFAALRNGPLTSRFALTGGDATARTVAKRPLAPLESYRVAITLEALRVLEQLGIPIPLDDEARERARPLSAVVADGLAKGLSAAAARQLIAEPRGRSRPALFVELSDVALTLSFANVEGNEPFAAVRDARVQTPDNFVLGASGRASLLYDGPLLAGGLIGTTQFNRTTLSLPDGSEAVQEPRDQALLEGDLRLQLPRLFGTSPALTPLPNLRVAYQTEWTPNVITLPDGKQEEQPRRAELRGLLGASLEPAPWLREVRFGFIVEADFADPTPGGLEWGAEAALLGEWRLGMLVLKLDSFARGYLPDPAHDTSDDIGLVTQAIGRVELPAFFGLNLSVFADAYALWGKLPETRGPATSLIVGAALSYGSRVKWLPFGR